MALKNAFCPNCGQPTQIDDTKSFCFCLSCGNKIDIPKREVPVIERNMTVAEHESKHRAQTTIEEQYLTASVKACVTAPDDKMKEVEFYYNLSSDKKEYADNNREPIYYLKAQDLLVDLSQLYATDYRVWWELCKPMDYVVIIAGEKSSNPGTINDPYFNKALDLAPLEIKMELIKNRDTYLEEKEKALRKIRDEQEARAVEERARIEEQKRKERQIEEKRQRSEQQRKQEEAEREKQERAEAAQKAAEFARIQQVMNPDVWASLAGKDYSALDNSYFRFSSPEGVTIIAIFKVITNVLYLNAFHIDTKKNNTVYLDQSIAIHFAEDGTAIKFDNRPVMVRGWNPPNNTIQVMANPEGGCMVNDYILISDADYVAGITRTAKKTIVSFSKLFA